MAVDDGLVWTLQYAGLRASLRRSRAERLLRRGRCVRNQARLAPGDVAPMRAPLESASGRGDSELLSLGEIVENYQLELNCSKCQLAFTRPIGFVRAHARMDCPRCGALTLLDLSLIRQEVRHIEKQMAHLHQQLLELLRTHSHFTCDDEQLPSFDDRQR